MSKQYLTQLKKGSVWYIANSQEAYGSFAYNALEAGEYIADETMKSTHCGRDGYMALYTQRGNGVLQIGDNKIILDPQSIVMLDCSAAYRLYKNMRSGSDWIFSWVRFTGDACRFLYETLNNEDVCVYAAEGHPKLETEFRHILTLFQQPGYEVYFKLSHSISTLLTAMVDLKLEQCAMRNRHYDIVSRSIQYIWENYDKPLDVGKLSEDADLSKYYFIKLFKELVHTAPYEYVITHRINESKKYLRGTVMKVSHISKAVGFKDECNFIRTFKKVTGITPSQYRKIQNRSQV